MKKLILSLVSCLFFVPCFSQGIEMKKLEPYLSEVENIINGKDLSQDFEDDFIVIEKEWYSNPRTKGQWYGKVKNMYLVSDKSLIPFTEGMMKVFYVMDTYTNNPDLYGEPENCDIGIIFFQRNEQRICIMIRTDRWYYGCYADLKKDKNGNFKIVNLPEYVYQHD